MLTCQLLERRKSSQYWKNKVLYIYILVYQIELCSVMIHACMCAYQSSFREILHPSNPQYSGRNPGNEFDGVERARVWRKFSNFHAIVTDQADHMLLNIQCSMSQPNPQPPSKCPQEIFKCPGKHTAWRITRVEWERHILCCSGDASLSKNWFVERRLKSSPADNMDTSLCFRLWVYWEHPWRSHDHMTV